ncbi:MAG: hypothetical protein OEW88_00705 [Gammaproteobacteria bacterium]|nr:hypothetical protein [Gammaproteobacteria bacterium]
MNANMTLALALAAVTLASTTLTGTALAQQPAGGTGAVISSQPGKVVAVSTLELSAQVISINKATRTVTLKGERGNVVEIVAGDEVRNFDQIKVGDAVVARYLEALTLELKKTRVAAGEPTVSEELGRAKAGERPAVAGALTIAGMADVVAVDPAKSTISLKGPQGNVVVLDVRNPDQFKVVKVGDQVEVTYTEAVALSVEPAAKAGSAKPK